MSNPPVKYRRYEAKNSRNCRSEMFACTSRGLKWFVRLKPKTDRRTPYFLVNLNSFASSRSSEKNCGKRVRSEFLAPTKFWFSSRAENGKPLRHSTIGEMLECRGKDTLPQATRRFGTSKA